MACRSSSPTAHCSVGPKMRSDLPKAAQGGKGKGLVYFPSYRLPLSLGGGRRNTVG